MKFLTALGLVGLATQSAADPTWPNNIDELEEIAFQLFSTNARKFADNVSPCSDLPFGPGRIAAAEWVRTAFHDTATGNSYTKVGGADASIQFELSNSDNSGIGFRSTLQWMNPFMTKKTSIADLLALGMYVAVRSCGGPQLEIKQGRVDATSSGSTGVPQVQNSIQILKTQFDRMGFNATEMIALTACGHTMGGAHSDNTPNAAPAGKYTNDLAQFDSTPSSFDNTIVTEYLGGNTSNPLVVGPYTRNTWRSDLNVFSSDGNVTMQTLKDPNVFQETCGRLLSRMVQLVPDSVILSDAIKPYVIKPYRIALTLNAGAGQTTLTGYIRVHTDTISKNSIKDMKITYKSRSGGTGGTYTTNLQGYGRGFDDEFAYFPLNIAIDTSVGISSFTIDVNLNDGTIKYFDNNGNGYPIQDYVFLQSPQSCLLSGSGAFTPMAAVHNSQTNPNVTAIVTYKKYRDTGANPVPQLLTLNVPMTKGDCYGDYTFYNANATIPGNITAEATIDIVTTANGQTYTDEFRRARDLSGSCRSFVSAKCNGGSSGNLSTSSTAVSSTTSIVVYSTTSSSVVIGETSSVTNGSATVTPASSTLGSTTTKIASTLTSASVTSVMMSAAPTETLAHKDVVGGYKLVSCWTEGSGVRALDGAATASDDMTLEKCAKFCSEYNYWGTEYGRECYCGNSVAASSSSADLSDCSMVCGGDDTEYCGAGDRLELYRTTAPIATPTGILVHVPTVTSSWSRVGCFTENDGVRALSAATTASDDMTLEKCGDFCSAYRFFGTEYGRECYCGDELASSSTKVEDSECGLVCAGDEFAYCGGLSRLELYSIVLSNATASAAISSPVASITSTVEVETASSPISESATSVPSSVEITSSVILTTTTASVEPSSTITSTSATVTATPTLQNYNSISPDWTFVGCKTEGNNTRALSATSTASSNMTLETCADYCADYKYFGTEYGSECYCGNSLAGSTLNATITDCSMTCSGNALQYCGASNRLTVYQSPHTGPTMPTTVGNYSLVGCQTEGSGVRALSSKTTSSASMTNEACAEFCAGATYFGTEYGSECYCGEELGSGSEGTDAEDCWMVCEGDKQEYCGAGDRLSLYKLGA